MRVFPPPATADQATRTGSRILIVRTSAIGDVIHGVPVLCALRKAMPDAFLAWLVEGTMGDLLEGHPALDELVRVPRRWWKSPRQVWEMRRRLRELRFDTTIDLQGLTKSAVSAWLSGAKRRIGKTGVHGREQSRWFNNELVEIQGTHVIDQYLSMLRPLGIHAPQVRFDLPTFTTEARSVEAFLRKSRLVGRRIALLNAGAGWPSKIWPAERYGALARHLGQTHGMISIALWGVAEEQPLAQRIVETSARHALLAPPTTMRELAELCRRALLFVGSDTGPMHLAVAVGTPTISLHGPTRSEVCGAYGPNNIRLQVRYQHGSSLQRRRADDAATRQITVGMVAAACNRLIGESAARQCG